MAPHAHRCTKGGKAAEGHKGSVVLLSTHGRPLSASPKPEKTCVCREEEDVISDPVSFQGPVQFYVLRNRSQRISGEGGWDQEGHGEFPDAHEFGEPLHRRQAQESGSY